MHVCMICMHGVWFSHRGDKQHQGWTIRYPVHWPPNFVLVKGTENIVYIQDSW